MIFYFTGTGNSLYTANSIAFAQGEQLISIAKEMEQNKGSYEYNLGVNELVGFVYPVYAWAPPKMVLEFIRKLKITGDPYVFSLCTCGGEEGGTTKVLRKALAAKGLPLDSAFGIRMPNNYMLGFDVDSKSVETEKLEAAEKKLIEINQIIEKRQKNIDHTIPGRFPALKTAIVNPMFYRFALNAGKFYADDNCTGCGICEKVCPVHTIKVSGKPTWGKNCTQCFGCINRCPVHAIQCGKGTVQKGRYHHLDLIRLENQDKASPEHK